MKQPVLLAGSGRRGKGRDVSEFIWETFDSLFKTVNRQNRRVEELETRVADLEQYLRERTAPQPKPIEQVITEMPAERAA